jgi:N-acetyl sugar amidotransferase
VNKQTCKTCVMDTTDPGITFDEYGVCDHCRGFDLWIRPEWNNEVHETDQIQRIAEQIRIAGKNADFDCLLGLSGGLDSSYLLHVAVKELGLRPLVFHVDGGWNSNIAVSNIEAMINELNLDLFTAVINWEEMRDLQLAFFKSGVSHLDVPQDHAFIATLYHFALKHKVKYILNGGNISTEGVRNPLSWLYYGSDIRQIRDIHTKFGERKLIDFPLTNVLWHKIYLRYIQGIKVVKPLNYVNFTKDKAIKLLEADYGWTSYPQKHFESRFTRFFEGYWLPSRFGYDTRKVQFSSLILTGQMLREDALKKLREPALTPLEVRNEKEFVASKLRISVDALEAFERLPKSTYRDFKSMSLLYDLGAKTLQKIGIERAIKR